MSGNRDIFLPNDRNLTLAFEGTDLEFTAKNIAKKLLNDHVVTRTPLTGDVFSYCCKNIGPTVDTAPFIKDAKALNRLINMTEEEFCKDLEKHGTNLDEFERKLMTKMLLDNLDN